MSRRGAKAASLALPDVAPIETEHAMATRKRMAPDSTDNLNDLKVVELRKRLKDHNLPTTGRKSELVDRLRAV